MARVEEDEPRIDWEAVDLIMMALMRLNAKLDLLLEEDDGEEEEDDAEVRAQLEDIRREVRELIEYLQTLRDSKR
jgi:hypothetical protein